MGCGKSKSQAIREQAEAAQDERAKAEAESAELKRKAEEKEEEARRKAEEEEQLRLEAEEQARIEEKERQEKERIAREEASLAQQREEAEQRRRDELAAAEAERELMATEDTAQLHQVSFLDEQESMQDTAQESLPVPGNEAPQKPLYTLRSISEFRAPGWCDPCRLTTNELAELETAPCSPRRSPLGPPAAKCADIFGCSIESGRHLDVECDICRNLDLTDAPLIP